jgi:hypothetical protein
MQYFFFLIPVLFIFQTCLPYKPRGAYELQDSPPTPDYAALSAWAAHPALQDPSDQVPLNHQDVLEWHDSVDVFFVHLQFKGSFFFRKKNYHIGDLNLYYMNVRENAALRVEQYFNGK